MMTACPVLSCPEVNIDLYIYGPHLFDGLLKWPPCILNKFLLMQVQSYLALRPLKFHEVPDRAEMTCAQPKHVAYSVVVAHAGVRYICCATKNQISTEKYCNLNLFWQLHFLRLTISAPALCNFLSLVAKPKQHSQGKYSAASHLTATMISS